MTVITHAEVTLPCDELDETLAFFTAELGFRIETIFPADAPRVAVLSGYGLRVRLQPDARTDAGVLRLHCNDAAHLGERVAPNGTRIELVGPLSEVDLPPLEPSLVIHRMSDANSWGVGRAGMHYRDLIPDRQGGRFIASHIRIVDGGPVPDYVHYHHVRFQMIYCYRGWVRLVYEDQGPPFVMQAGDCVLQPPAIRHRVLESSPGLEVIEIGTPAEHLTCVDHELSLPTPERRPERDFGGQRYVFHEAATARWTSWRVPGFEVRDTGIGAATGGIASAKVARVVGPVQATTSRHDGEFLFLFVLQGGTTLEVGNAEALLAGDAVVVPAGQDYALAQCTPDLELLEVTLPGS